MKNSGITIAQVKEAFSKADDLKNADASYYFNSAFDWSENGNMRKDWIATIRSFARRDIRDGKLKLSVHRSQGGTNQVMGKQYEPPPLPKVGAPMPDSLKKRISKIGKA